MIYNTTHPQDKQPLNKVIGFCIIHPMKDLAKQYNVDPAQIRRDNIPMVNRAVIASGTLLGSEKAKSGIEKAVNGSDITPEQKKYVLEAVSSILSRYANTTAGEVRDQLTNKGGSVFSADEVRADSTLAEDEKLFRRLVVGTGFRLK